MTQDSSPRDLVGYGRAPPHAAWPGGARIAVQCVLNYEEGAEANVLDGDPGAETFLSDIPNAPAVLGARHMSMEQIYEYGSRAARPCRVRRRAAVAGEIAGGAILGHMHLLSSPLDEADPSGAQAETRARHDRRCAAEGRGMRELTPEPLTAEAFAVFGSVIEANDEAVKLDINQGHAVRYDRLAEVDVADEGGVGVISLFRARLLAEPVLKTFERHPLGSQSFVPLSGRPYLVAVAPAGDFDAAKVRLFRAEGHQGVHYRKGVWHHFLLVLDEGSDFLVVDRAGPGDNCEEVVLAEPIQVRR